MLFSLLSSTPRRKKEKACHLVCGSLHGCCAPTFFFFFQRVFLPPFDASFWVAQKSGDFCPLLQGLFFPVCGGFLFTLCGFFFLFLLIVDVLDLEPLTQIQTLGVFFQLDLVCPVQDQAFLFLGFQICSFFTQIRTLCYFGVVPPAMLGLFQT